MPTYCLQKNPFVRSLLAAAVALTLPGYSLAESLEARVQALEQGQERQSEALQAVTDAVRQINVSGFLSIRGGQIDSEELSYLNTLNNDWTFSEESVAGLQVDAMVSDKLSASLQLKYSGLSDGVELEWGYLEYAFQPDLKLRAGRLRAPGFMLSEYLDVGYAYPWAQVPFEVYGWLPFNRYEGMDLRYWTSLGDVDVRLSTFLGTSSDQKLRLGNFEYTDQTTQFAGMEVQATYDIYTVRASYSKYRFNMTNPVLDSFLLPLVNGVTVVPGIDPYIQEVKIPGLVDYVDDVMVGDGSTPGSGVLTDTILILQNDGDPANDFLIPILQAEGVSLRAQVEPYQGVPSMEGKSNGKFYGAGFSADNGQYLLMSEVSFSTIDGVSPDVESGYIMLGYRFGNWMPNFTFAKMYTVNDDVWPDLQPLEANAAINQFIPGYDQLVAGANIYTGGMIITRNAMRVEQESYTLGVRWDPIIGLAAKAEVFVVDLKNDSYGFAMPKSLLTLTEANATDFAGMALNFPEPDENVTGVRVSLDMVF